jgi:hypothetical protein
MGEVPRAWQARADRRVPFRLGRPRAVLGGLVGVGRENERGTAYARYIRAVADNPDFVGAHWFQYLDEPLTGRTLDGENAHIGFVTVADLPYTELSDAARTANLAILHDLQRVGSQ